MIRRLGIFVVSLFVCATAHAEATVVWISIDAFRHDYIERFHPPTLSRLAAEGAFTRQQIPIFPSLTFPNHIAQATGATVDRHGIPFNTFYDTQTRQTYDFPDHDTILRAEPIWITAKRQGLRVAVFDWPMAHEQTGPFKSDFSFERFDRQMTDDQRLAKAIEVLKTDKTNPPIRFVMTYMSRVDTIGHRNGPDSPQLEQAIREADASLDRFTQAIIAWFSESHGPQDDLYLFITTDHGIEMIKTLVSLERAIGVDLMAGAKLQLGGPIASVDLSEVPAADREARAEQIVTELKKMDMIQAWKSKDVPAKYHFADPSRIGDVIALLPPGYNFTLLRTATTLPARGGNVAAHGYDPAVSPNMLGFALVWRYKHPMGGKDLGPVENTQWHATVARLLGIQPSEKSDPRAISLP